MLRRAIETLALAGLALLVELPLLLLRRAWRRAPGVIRPHPIELERPFAGLALDRPGMVGSDRGLLVSSVAIQHLCLQHRAGDAQYEGDQHRFHQVCTSLRWRCTLMRMPAAM